MKSSFSHLAAALVVSVTALVGYGFWYAAVVGKSADVARVEREIAAKIEAASRASSVRATLAEVADDEVLLGGYFIPEAGVATFIDDLEARGTAQVASVKVLSVATDDTGARKNLKLDISIEGTFDAVLRTFGSIEHAPYDLRVTTLSLTQNDEGRGGWRASAKLVVGMSVASPDRP